MAISKMSLEEFERRFDEAVVPDFSKLSSAELTQHILNYEQQRHGIDWLQAASQGEEGLKGAYAKFSESLKRQVAALSPAELDYAKKAGYVGSDGQIVEFWLPTREAAAGPVPFPDGAQSYSVWGWKPETVKKYADARGGDVEKYIKNLVANFQVMNDSDEVGLVKIMLDAGIWAFGLYGTVAVFNIIKALVVISRATEAYAVLEGVLTIGINIIRVMISVVVLAIIVPLIYFMEKDAAGLFVIINNTPSDLVMSDIYFTHGKCVAGFKKDASADNPQAIIPAIFEIYNPNEKKTVTGISAGFFAIKKRDLALIGPRGALKFAPTPEFPAGAFFGSEIPLAIGGNRLLVSATYSGSASGFSDKTDDSGSLDSQDRSTAGHTIQGHMSGSGGSYGYAFVTLE